MSESKHTKGPWKLETVTTSAGTCHKIGPFPSRGVYDETHACVYADSVHMHDYGHSKIGDELLANARLIASAPDLLEALDDCVRKINTLYSGGSYAPGVVSNTLDAACAAISKATGAA